MKTASKQTENWSFLMNCNGLIKSFFLNIVVAANVVIIQAIAAQAHAILSAANKRNVLNSMQAQWFEESFNCTAVCRILFV